MYHRAHFRQKPRKLKLICSIIVLGISNSSWPQTQLVWASTWIYSALFSHRLRRICAVEQDRNWMTIKSSKLEGGQVATLKTASFLPSTIRTYSISGTASERQRPKNRKVQWSMRVMRRRMMMNRRRHTYRVTWGIWWTNRKCTHRNKVRTLMKKRTMVVYSLKSRRLRLLKMKKWRLRRKSHRGILLLSRA